jgi:hypothetical protein
MAIWLDRVSRLGQFRFFVAGWVATFCLGAAMAQVWPPYFPSEIAGHDDAAAATLVGLWLAGLAIAIWMPLFYMRVFCIFLPSGEARDASDRPTQMHPSERGLDARLTSLGFHRIGALETRLTGRGWHHFWQYVSPDGTVSAYLGRVSLSTRLGFTTYWTNGYHVTARFGPRTTGPTLDEPGVRDFRAHGTLPEALEQFRMEAGSASARFGTTAHIVLTTSMSDVLAHELDDLRFLPLIAERTRRSPVAIGFGVFTALFCFGGLVQAVLMFPWSPAWPA